MRFLGTNVTASDFEGELGGVKYTVNATAPTSPTPLIDDIWVDTTAKLFKRYTGSIWETIGGAGGNAFSTISVSGQSDVVADQATDTLTLVAGTNVTLVTNASTDTITISAALGGGAVTTLFSDDFMRTPSTTTMGSSWTAVAGTWGIQNDKAYSVTDDAFGDIVVTTSSVGAMDHSIYMRAIFQPEENVSDREIGIITRYIDSSNYLRWQFWSDASTTTNSFIDLMKVDAGVQTRIAQLTITGTGLFHNDVYYDFRCVSNGNVLTVYVNGLAYTSYTLTGGDITKFGAAGAGTKVGIYQARNGAAPGVALYDSFTVTDYLGTAMSDNYLATTGGQIQGGVHQIGNLKVIGITSFQGNSEIIGQVDLWGKTLVHGALFVDDTLTQGVSTNATVTGTIAMDLSTGNIFDWTLTGNVTTMTITNVPASGQHCETILYLRQGGTARTVAWPASVQWSGGTAAVITTINKTYIIKLKTINGGTRWYGSQEGTNYTT